MDESRFGREIAKIREDKNFSRKSLASAAKISASYLSIIETGRGVPPPRLTCEKILDGLGVGGKEREDLLRRAAFERGSTDEEESLPRDVRQLLMEVRRVGHLMPTKFVKQLRHIVRGVTN